MNLFDIVRRPDRSLVIDTGKIEPISRSGFVGARLSPKARIRLSGASEFVCLSTFPRELGWRLPAASPNFELSAVNARDATVLYRSAGEGGASPAILDWPTWASDGFDLELTNRGDDPVEIASGASFNPRLAVSSLIRGKGIEVGPGASPFVKNSEDTKVKYLEAYSAEDWQRMYHKEREEVDFSQYIIGDAHHLSACADASLDFIFSSHVFEHLMNPLGVLENWSRKLSAAGVIIAVVPDLRYCFDLRQPASQPRDWQEEYAASEWTPSRAKFEKWCRYTWPYATPDSLIQRKYSIHAHYYTPTTVRTLLDMAIERGMFRKLFINTSPNNKDFAFVVWK